MYWCESWTIKKAECLKNRCFQTVVLEKALESPLDSKEIKPVNPRGNQPWIFIGRTDADCSPWGCKESDATGRLIPQPDLRGRRGWRLSSISLPWWLSGQQFVCQYMRHRRHQFDPWVERIYWRRKWQPLPVFLPGKSHGQRSLEGYIVFGVAKSRTWLSNWTLTSKGSNWVNHAYIMRPSWNPKRKEFGFWRASGVVNLGIWGEWHAWREQETRIPFLHTLP